MLAALSETEREAIEAGDVWWDADLFTGNPDWDKLLAFPPAKLTDEEQAFLDGPVEELCAMVDDWRINWEWHDLPPEVWDFLKAQRFFAMIIPKQYGGLGFSPLRALRGDPQAVDPLAHRRRDRHGAELARPGRTADAVRHQGAARPLAAAARRAARKFPASA